MSIRAKSWFAALPVGVLLLTECVENAPAPTTPTSSGSDAPCRRSPRSAVVIHRGRLRRFRRRDHQRSGHLLHHQ
ncbi:MAG: hypothetical protein R2722_10945 [Tessaracoccus sp.]